MRFVDVLLLPGTLICKRLNISEGADEARLARSMFNTLFYLIVSLVVLSFVVV